MTFDDLVEQAQWAEDEDKKVVVEMKEKRLKHNPQAEWNNQRRDYQRNINNKRSCKDVRPCQNQ